MRAGLFGLRAGIVLLVLLAVLPAMVVIVLSARDRRADSLERLDGQATQLAASALASYEHSIDATRTFLLPLANIFTIIPDLSELTDEACAPVLDELLASDDRFLYVGGATADGEIFCGSPGSAEKASMAGTPFFDGVVETRDFAVGGLATDTLTGRPTLRTGYPILGLGGALRGVAFVALDLQELAVQLGATAPPGSAITITDETGLVLARYPDREAWIGTSAAPSAAEASSGGLRLATVEQEAPFAAAGNTVRATAGIPEAPVLSAANRRLRNDLFALGAVGVLALALAWAGSSFVFRDLRRYTRTTQRLAAGDLAARVGPPYPRNELGSLGQSFDTMAGALAERAAEVQRLNDDLERRVQERTAELKRANGELESFSYSVSHDLRAPLRAIDGYTRIVLEEHGDQLPAEARRYFDAVRANAKQMGKLIDDLLAFSRLGRRQPVRTTVSMSTLAREIADELKPRDDTARELTIEIGELPDCACDPTLLRQVLVNLISNAVKFTRPVPRGRIEVGFSGEEDAYYVRDNGVGFDMAYADKLFGVFQRLHRAEDFEGTGVGLAIVQRIIQRHGGTTWAISDPGVETTFYFSIGKDDQRSED